MKVKCSYCGNSLTKHVKRKNYFCSTLHHQLFNIDQSKKMTKEERSIKYNFKKYGKQN